MGFLSSLAKVAKNTAETVIEKVSDVNDEIKQCEIDFAKENNEFLKNRKLHGSFVQKVAAMQLLKKRGVDSK